MADDLRTMQGLAPNWGFAVTFCIPITKDKGEEPALLRLPRDLRSYLQSLLTNTFICQNPLCCPSNKHPGSFPADISFLPPFDDKCFQHFQLSGFQHLLHMSPGWLHWTLGSFALSQLPDTILWEWLYPDHSYFSSSLYVHTMTIRVDIFSSQ